MSTRYYQKNKERFQKRHVRGIKIFLKKIKAKSVNALANDTEIFLKKKKIKSVSIAANDIDISLKMKNKG